MIVIVGKTKAVELGKDTEAVVYRISERRFCITNDLAWETGLESEGIWRDHTYMDCVYDPYKNRKKGK